MYYNISVYYMYVQVHKCEKNFHTYKKLQAEITEKFKNFKVSRYISSLNTASQPRRNRLSVNKEQ